MKKDYTLPQFNEYRDYIRKLHDRGISWDDIKYARQGTLEGLDEFLKDRSIDMFWEIDTYDWLELYSRVFEEIQFRVNIDENERSTVVRSKAEIGNITLPTAPGSSWNLYKKRLEEVSKFSKEAIDDIEETTLNILSTLSTDTTDRGPVKGLVIGNVQSGKTANMAALMAMGADLSYNFFIILSGTIDNLRVQTQDRMVADLNSPYGNLSWKGLSHLSRRSPSTESLSSCQLHKESKDRYFTVTLKNTKRLKNLIDWIQSDKEKMKQLKIMVIDDESDQASIRITDIENDERKGINALITNLVEGLDKDGKKCSSNYRSMNYIGYTATPYANLLNEIGRESLFPSDFIVSLGQSNEYFGPQQIFGVEGKYSDGLNIVRRITTEEIGEIKEIHEGNRNIIPDSLSDALAWFICASAAQRYRGIIKPLTMLVHTSIKVDHHTNFESLISAWFMGKKSNIISICRDIWELEKEKFTYEDFVRDYPNYGINPILYTSLPEFDEIIDEVTEILSEQRRYIQIDDDGELIYGNGINICVDNSKADSIYNEDVKMRLVYPKSMDEFEKAPLFIVIGGATLSRGLTLEGLVCSYFVRPASMADSLMQMGRWFGYRRNYELYPRIWMTSQTRDQFRYLSTMDEELRESIITMNELGQDPREVGVKIKNSPASAFLQITSKIKMQSMIETDIDFTGVMSQVVLFDNDDEILKSNIRVVEKFINSLGSPREQTKNVFTKSSLVFENVEFSLIENLLFTSYQISNKSRSLNNLPQLVKWINETTEEGLISNWNVIVAGKGVAIIGHDEETKDENRWYLDAGSIEKVTRSRRSAIREDSVLDLGVLRAPKDLIADISQEMVENLSNDKINSLRDNPKFNSRNKLGLETTPQLVIYRVDKNSDAPDASSTRASLSAKHDLIGIAVHIPSGKGESQSSYSKSLIIDTSLYRDDSFVDISGGEAE